MLLLDEAGDSLADTIRDSMDAVWWSLTDDERRGLDSRTPQQTVAIRLTGSERLFASPPPEVDPRPSLPLTVVYAP